MLDLLFFAAIAAFLAFRFYNTIGKKDHRPDEDVLRKLREVQRQAQAQEKDENVITLRPDEVREVNETPLDPAIANDVREIQKKEPDFDPVIFVERAKRAFEMIIEAFAKGDKKTLENLLDEAVYKEFLADIEAREKANTELVVTLVSGPTAEIKEVTLDGKDVTIAVEFDSREIRILKDDKGRILEGDPSEAEAVKDLWSFKKKLDKKSTIWKLVDTEAVE